MTEKQVQLRRILQAARTPSLLIYLGGYAALLAWFKLADVYHTQFATRGVTVVVWNAFRVLFIFYLFWIVHAVGALALRWVGGRPIGLPTIERLVLGFFAGAGLWHIGLLALGYLNLYTVPVALAVTLPAVAITYPDARAATVACWRRISSSWRRAALHERLTIAGIVAASLLLLLIKGLYPGGGHDYYTHYFYYYQAVIDHGGLWPNDVWYHYYYSKGCGLFFLSMLLSDPLAPQLVTFCFMAVAAAVLFLAVKDVAPETNWPSASVLIFISIYVFSPGWGEFEKGHEFNTALLIGIIWMAQRAFQTHDQLRAQFFFACALAVSAAIIINVEIGAYFGAVFVVLALALVVFGDRRNSLLCIALTTWAGTMVVLILFLNYATTGMPLDQGVTHTWPLVDVEKLFAWGSLSTTIELYRGTKGLAANALPLISVETGKLMIKSLRLDLLYPLVGVGITAACRSIYIQRKHPSALYRNHATPYIIMSAAACVLVCVLMALTAGRTQPVSFHRYSTFVVPIMILLGITLCNLGTSRAGGAAVWTTQNHLLPSVVAAICLFIIFYDARLHRHLDVPSGALKFMAGAASIDDAYVLKGSWPYHSRWGGIYPGARGAYTIVGPRTPIWSLHMHSYCMLPDCRIETYMSFNMTDRWDRVMFGSAQEARQVLQRSGINYFLFSHELVIPALGITDPLPLSNLFSPDNIAHNLALRWTDGTTSLLTWPGPDTSPLDDAWVAAYREAVKNSGAVQSFPFSETRDVYERYYALPHPWRPIPLPW